jgi:hypothetical protein
MMAVLIVFPSRARFGWMVSHFKVQKFLSMPTAKLVCQSPTRTAIFKSPVAHRH